MQRTPPLRTQSSELACFDELVVEGPNFWRHDRRFGGSPSSRSRPPFVEDEDPVGVAQRCSMRSPKSRNGVWRPAVWIAPPCFDWERGFGPSRCRATRGPSSEDQDAGGSWVESRARSRNPLAPLARPRRAVLPCSPRPRVVQSGMAVTSRGASAPILGDLPRRGGRVDPCLPGPRGP